MAKTYKHSGTIGDLIYSLALAKHFGPGKFYLHLNQINWIVQHYYNSKPLPFHQDRMTVKDFEFMKDFMLSQPYITDFLILDPKTTEITHNLDRFRELFVGHPGNYIDIYAASWSINDPVTREKLRNEPWLTADPKRIEGKSVVVNRTERWVGFTVPDYYRELKDNGIDKQSIFLGLPQEFELFQKQTGWADCTYYPTNNLLEWAELIKGAELYVGNQSMGLSLAIGLGTKFSCEARPDLPPTRNECFFPNHPNGTYF